MTIRRHPLVALWVASFLVLVPIRTVALRLLAFDITRMLWLVTCRQWVNMLVGMVKLDMRLTRCGLPVQG